jgi:hypothetical protein
MRITIESTEEAGLTKAAASTASMSGQADMSGGAASAAQPTGAFAPSGRSYAPAPASISSDPLSRGAIDAGPPPAELLELASRTSGRPIAAAADSAQSTRDGGSAPPA